MESVEAIEFSKLILQISFPNDGPTVFAEACDGKPF